MRKLLLRPHGLVAWLVLILAACQWRPLRADDVAAPYAVDAAGRPVRVESSLSLSWPGHENAGLILNAEICHGQVYLLAPAQKFVQVADLPSGVALRRIGKPGNGPEDLRRPVSFGVDCEQGTLYVVEGKGGVLAFALADGRYTTTFPYAPEFKPSMGARTLLSGDGSRLILAGLWSPRPSSSPMVGAQMFDGHQIGLQLPIGDPSGQPVAAAYERGCHADFTACVRVDLQPLDSGDGWVAALGGSTRVVVLNREGAVVRAIDVRSPAFLRDGTTPKEETEAQLEWGVTNSTLWGLYAIDDRIAVIHARNATKNWKRGQIMQFDVFLNLYSVAGDRLISDVRLPGLPVGRDREHMLILDYGPLGRRSDATEVSLVKVPIRDGTVAFHQ